MSLSAVIFVAISAYAMLLVAWLLTMARGAEARVREAAARDHLIQRIRFLTGHVSDCVILTDASGRVLEVSERCLGMYGYAEREWQGLNMGDWVADKHFILPALVQRVPEERSIACSSRHVRKDGTQFEAEMHANPTEVDGGACYQLVIRDLGAPEHLLHRLTTRLVNIQEEEWQRLGTELHDQVGANLAAINLNLRSIRNMISDSETPVLHLRLAETGRLLADTISSISGACAGLRPAVLYCWGLVSALEELVQRVGRRGDMEVRFRQDNMQARLPAQTESLLYRIAQEALTNCIKHSCARRVEVVISRHCGGIVLSVSDDGIGFDPEMPRSAGLGLLTQRERAAMAGGRFSIRSCPGQGTCASVEITLEAEPLLDGANASSPSPWLSRHSNLGARARPFDLPVDMGGISS